jgi:ribulose-phosphate 3-epimerase
VDRIQWDVMDGVFVPNLTFGPDVVAACRPHASVPFEAHLMVQDPNGMLGLWVEAGCEILILHAETTTHLHRSLAQVQELGARAAVSINPPPRPARWPTCSTWSTWCW